MDRPATSTLSTTHSGLSRGIACIERPATVSRSGEETHMRKLLMTLVVVLAGTNLAGCGYNKLQNQDESVKAAWSEVVNQYQRRADLIPNLVATVKGFAAQEERVLVGVTEARAKATSIQLTPELINNPQAFQQFQQAQGQLTQALKSLLVTVERYPELKS